MYIMVSKLFGVNMDVKLLGFSFNLINLAIAVGLGYLILMVAGCSCSKIGFREGMQRMGSALNYKMGQGVPGLNVGWDLKAQQSGSALPYRKQQHDTYQGTSVPLKGGQLFMFAGNDFKPSCCGSTFSNSTGCMCATKEQINYVNMRGGNRTCGCGEY